MEWHMCINMLFKKHKLYIYIIHNDKDQSQIYCGIIPLLINADHSSGPKIARGNPFCTQRKPTVTAHNSLNCFCPYSTETNCQALRQGVVFPQLSSINSV